MDPKDLKKFINNNKGNIKKTGIASSFLLFSGAVGYALFNSFYTGKFSLLKLSF